MFTWLWKNRSWVFSGVGVVVSASLLGFLLRSRDFKGQSVNNNNDSTIVQVSGSSGDINVYNPDVADQAFNEDKDIRLSLESENFEKLTNRRFGFYLLYPKTWEAHLPENGDGFRIYNPDNNEVELIAYGRRLNQWSFMMFNREILEEEVTFMDLVKISRDDLVEEKSAQIHSEWRAGIRLEDLNQELKPNEFNDNIYTGPGWRYEYSYEDASTKKRYKVLETLAMYNGLTYHLIFQAPENSYSEYRDLFIKLTSEFKILTTSLEAP